MEVRKMFFGRSIKSITIRCKGIFYHNGLNLRSGSDNGKHFVQGIAISVGHSHHNGKLCLTLCSILTTTEQEIVFNLKVTVIIAISKQGHRMDIVDRICDMEGSYLNEEDTFKGINL